MYVQSIYHNDLLLSANAGHESILVLLDLITAFNTIVHDILLDHLENWVGIYGTALKWFRSYLKDRCFCIGIADSWSATTGFHCRVPQGSVLDPILFYIYMLPQGYLICRHNISFHFYADDTQIYLNCDPENNRAEQNNANLLNCLNDIHTWKSPNFLQLNADKTEILIIGQDSTSNQISNSLGSRSHSITQHCRSLIVTFDQWCFMVRHVS